MKYLKSFNESIAITDDLVNDVKDIFFSCFDEEFDNYLFKWWSDDNLERLADDIFYIEIEKSDIVINLVVNSVFFNDPFVDDERFIKLERFKGILKSEYDLTFNSSFIDWGDKYIPNTYQEFFFTTYTIS